MTAPARHRPLAWTVLVASGLSILLAGLAGTAVIVRGVAWRADLVTIRFLLWFLAACGLVLVSLGIRTLRWVFLLRRAEVRIPIRDATIGYMSGFTLLFAPLLLGELAIRAYVHRMRANVPVAATCVVNLWERYLDLFALAVLVVGTTTAHGRWQIALLVLVVASLSRTVRSMALAAVAALVHGVLARVLRAPTRIGPATLRRLTSHGTWLAAGFLSIGAWLLPGLAFWGLAHTVGPFSVRRGWHEYAASALRGGIALAPGGVLVVGPALLDDLNRDADFSSDAAALTVFAVRVSTVGVATALGAMLFWVHARSGRKAPAAHFDDIAHAYDAQIPRARRIALVSTKAELMRSVLLARRTGTHGLDVGCGQGWYVARMRELGFDVRGIDNSAAQLSAARQHLGDPTLVDHGSMLEIPAADGMYNFVYCINTLHHLGSVAEQQAAFAELMRVLKPGGLLFVHEINTRNPLFRFYMGYVFPTLNCIDEGVERWLVPPRLDQYTPVPVAEVHYFTFLPEFLPPALVRALRPLERRLERTSFRVFSAHYMAVLQKPIDPDWFATRAGRS